MSSGVIVVKNDFGRVAKQLEVKAKAAEDHAAERIAARANRAAPVGETGRLSRGTRAHGNEVVNDVPYGGYVNRGTRYMAAQPFFDRAVEEERRRFELEIMEALH